MTIFGFGKAYRRALIAASVGVSVVPAVAQDDAAAEADSGINPAAERVVKEDMVGAFQIRTGETDFLPGRLQVFDSQTGESRPVGTTGILIVQNGRIVGRGETDIGGVAQLRNLQPGPYSVIAIGPDGMAAFGLEVLPIVPGVATSSYRFDAMLVPADDMAVAQGLLAGGAAPAAPVSTETEEGVQVEPTQLGGATDGLASGAAAPLKGETIVVPSGGEMVSHLVVLDPRTGQPIPMGNSRVHFLRDGQVLGSVTTDAQGICSVSGLEDGIYSMVGTGPNGFVAIGVRVSTVLGAATADASEAAVTYVSFLQGGGANMEAAGASADALPFAPGFGAPGPFGPGGPGAPGPIPGGGGFGGGGGMGAAGGGGGFGGGGLLGALLGAGLGAGLGAALSDDDNNNGGGVVVSPAAPPAP